jgi:glycine reductase
MWAEQICERIYLDRRKARCKNAGTIERRKPMLSIVHVVNQFFAGIGGEDKADTPVGVLDDASGVTRGLQTQLGKQAQVIGTIYCGDNYFHEHSGEARAAVLRELRERKPDVVIAGPAFNSGRYGLACVEICHMIAGDLGIPCVTAMHEENPAVETHQTHRDSGVFLLPTAETVSGMTDALKALAKFAVRLGNKSEIGSAEKEGYLPRGIRRLVKADRPGFERAIEMLLRKVRNEPFVTELPMEAWDQVRPAGLSEIPSGANTVSANSRKWKRTVGKLFTEAIMLRP